MEVSELSDEEVKNQFKTYYERVEIVDCFGVDDLIRLNLLKKEINSRSLEVEV